MEWAGIILLWHWYLLGRDLGLPEFVGCLGLLDTFLGQMSVGPGDGVISFEL
jgi:hypothetical protein